MTSTLAAEIAEIARRIARLAPDRRDPERYHCDKSELIAALRKLNSHTMRAEAAARVRPRVPR